MMPRITGATPAEQLQQIQSYLYQFSEQLKYALNHLSVENFSEEGKQSLSQAVSGAGSGVTPEQQSQFQELRALIIKTAHTIESFQEEIRTTLKYEYVAKSEYGEYQKDIEAEIHATAENVTQYYTETKELQSALEETEAKFDSYLTNLEGYIRTGIVGEDEAGNSILGVEIGERKTQTVDGEEVIVSEGLRSRFTSDRLSFYQGEAEVAYISNQRLYITDAEVSGSFTLGDWLISTANGLTLRYVGGES